MRTRHLLTACIAAVLSASAGAQTPPSRPLNLELPPGSIPAATGSSSAPARATRANPAATHTAPSMATGTPERPDPSAPGVYYGDTSGGTDRSYSADASACDDSTYNQPQVHGSVGMGVMTGNHVSGNYQTGTINFSKATGSCEHPTGGVSISIGVGQGHVNGGGWRH